MQRPPQLPSLLLGRQAYQWINRVNQKFNALSALKLSPENKQRLKHWLEVEFVYGALAFEDSNVSRQQIMQAATANTEDATLDSSAAVDLFAGLRLVEELAQNAAGKATLDLTLLLQLNQPQGFGELRKTPAQTSAIGAEHLPLILENACRWFAMASFAELNPVEQAAIALLRLLELAPFEQNNQRTSLLAASLFTLRSQLPPIIFTPEQREVYVRALQEGLRMNTQPMVELVAAAAEQTLDEMMKFITEDS